ncbi:MAG: CPBP family intramembrane glutamic endopeptidase [Candidatus Hodarchaeales archaeon]
MYKAIFLYLFTFILLVAGFSIEILSPVVVLSQVILLIGVLLLWKTNGNKLIDLGFKKDEKARYFLVLGVVEAVIGVAVLICGEVVFGLIIVNVREFNVLMLLFLGLISLKLLILVIIEEVCFRGFYLQVITEKSSATTGIIVSSMLWAFLHIPNMIWKSDLSSINLIIGIVSIFFIGSALGFAYFETKRTLWFSLGFHFGYNLSFNTAHTLFFIEENAPNWLLGQADWIPESGVVGLIFTISILILTYFMFKREKTINLVD